MQIKQKRTLQSFESCKMNSNEISALSGGASIDYSSNIQGSKFTATGDMTPTSGSGGVGVKGFSLSIGRSHSDFCGSITYDGAQPDANCWTYIDGAWTKLG